jgi:hypothetical protein
MAITPSWALRVGAPNCLNRPAATGMATTVTADDTSLTFTALDGLDGRVVTFSESSTNATFTGTDSNNSACTAADRGRVAGINIPHIANQFNGTSTSSAQGILTWQATSPSPPRKHRTEGSKNRRKHNEENQW